MFISNWFFRKAVVIPFLAIAYVGLSPAVQAASTYSVWYNADVLTQGSGGAQDRTLSFSGCVSPACTSAVYLPQTSITAPQYSASTTGVRVTFTQQADATWDGAAMMGSLNGSSWAHASVSPAISNPYNATGQSGPATTGGTGWSDTAIITSSTLSAGTPVDLLFTLRMDSQIGLLGASVVCLDTGNRAYADSRFTLGGVGGILLSMKQDTCAYGGTNSATSLVTTALGSSSNEISSVYHTTVGAALPIGGWLSTYAKANATAAKPDMTAWAIADTSFYIDVMTTGASYSTASGVSYYSPVPLPGAIWFLASGLAGLAGFARRHSRR